ncbi:MAG: metal-dependent transcriptional regulator [Actinomycetota bacterium]|nr:metal-dependent transcriptional regulator [Actinomycetota bacterium]
MPKQSAAVQDYLKAMYMLSMDGPPEGTVSTQALAERLGVSAASATNMIKKLASLGLVEHLSYRGAALTEPGRKIALEVIRHHRLLETYLAEALGVPWDRVHAEAEVLEHVLSEDLEDRIAARLGNPTVDPHGHPIPDKDGTMPAVSGMRLWDASEGERVLVDRVSDAEADALRYLAELGIKPGSRLEVLGRGPVGGPLFVRIDGGGDDMNALSKEISEVVWVA